jgi:hypothetical protein
MKKRTSAGKAPATGLPANAEMTYRDFIKDIVPEISPMIRRTWQRDWVGAGVYKTAETFLMHLDTHGGALPEIQSLYKPAELNIPASPTHEMSFVRDTFGEVLDVDAYMNGQPECFLTIQPAECIKSNLTIRVIHGMSAGVDAREATEKYMLVADLYTAAMAKYNVRIVFEWGGEATGGDKGWHYLWKLNVCDYGQPLDPYTLVSALSTPMNRAMLMGMTGKALGTECTWCGWHDTHKHYLNTDKPSVERKEGEIIIAPITTRNMGTWNLPDMLKAAGLTEEA